MKFDVKKSNLLITLFTILFTYIIVKVVYNVSGFYYGFDDGISIKLFIDLALWTLVYLTIRFILIRIFSK